MKKYLSVGLILLLCLTLSIPSFAVGNSYSFTSSWWQVCFNNSLVFSNNVEKSTTVQIGKARADGILYNSDRDYNSFLVWLENSNIPSGTTNIVIPLNLLMLSSYEYLDLEFLIAYEGNVTVNSATVQIDNSNYSTSIDVTPFDELEFGSLTFPSSSANFGTFVPSYTGKGYRVGVRYKKNISSSEQTIDSITLNLSTGSTSLAVGVPCNNNTVVLPDSFYDAIYSVKLVTRLIYSNIVDINSNIFNIQSQIDEIIGKVGSSTEEQNNYYNTIINESPEQAEKLAALQAELEQAKQDLADFQEKFNSYDPPVPDDVLPNEEVTQITIDSLNNEDTSVVYGLLFGNELFLGILVLTLSIATIGYILYGKRA